MYFYPAQIMAFSELSRLKSISFSILIFTSSCFYCVSSIDLLEECLNTEDSHVTRGAFTCCKNSPRSLPLEAPLDFEKGWKICAVEPESVNEDPVISAWRVYRCIVFQGLPGKPLLPTTFSDLMSSKYPALIKTKIFNKMSELEEVDMKFEVDVECLKRTPYPKVHLLRNLFYDIEQDICEAGNNLTVMSSDAVSRSRSRPTHANLYNLKKSSSSFSPSDLAALLCETCDRSQEMYHRNGDCCSHVPIPFPFIYLPYRYGNHDRVGQCAEDLADEVGLPVDTEFSKHLQSLCYSSCEYHLSGMLEESEMWAGPRVIQSQSEIRALVMKMMPKYVSSKYKQNVMTYVLRKFRSAWVETKTFESRIQLSQMDNRNCDKGKLKNLLVSCKTHRLIETISNVYMNNMCLEQYPTQQLNPTTPESLIAAFNMSYMTTPVSGAVSNDDVTLNFDWGKPSHSNSHNSHHSHGKPTYDENDEDSYMNPTFITSDYGNMSSRSKGNWWWPSTTTSSTNSRHGGRTYGRN